MPRLHFYDVFQRTEMASETLSWYEFKEFAVITNERQCQITKEKADRFARALGEYDPNKPDSENVSNRLLQIERSAMKAQLTVLRDEIENYERGKD